MRPSLELGLLVVCLAAAACGAAAGVENDAYLAWLGREEVLLAQAQRSSVQSSGTSASRLEAAAALARRPGGDLNPQDTAWLADDCERILAAKPPHRATLLRNLAARLAAYRSVAQSERPARVDPGRARETLRRILAGKEFAWGSAERSWLERIWRRIADLVGHALYYLFSSGIIYWALIAVGALAAGGVLTLIIGALRGRPSAFDDAGSGGSDRPSQRHQAKKEDLIRLAEEAHGDGRYREALRWLYVALLQELDRSGAIRLVRHKTNWDYRREIEGSRQDLARVFGPFTELYEAKWYGRESCAAEHYLEARRLYETAREVSR